MGTKTFQALMDRNLNILNIYEDATHAAEKENIAWKCEQAAYNIIFDRLYFPDQLTSGQLKKVERVMSKANWCKRTSTVTNSMRTLHHGGVLSLPQQLALAGTLVAILIMGGSKPKTALKILTEL
jgi:hypothetical protein